MTTLTKVPFRKTSLLIFSLFILAALLGYTVKVSTAHAQPNSNYALSQ